MIFADGVRSRKLLWLAKKQLYILRNIVKGILKKSVVYNGFTVGVSIIDENLDNGRITAPTGLRVICSTDNGFYTWDYDFIFGASGTPQKCHALNDNLTVQSEKFTALRGADGLELREITQHINDPDDSDWEYIIDEPTYTNNAKPVIMPVFDSEIISRAISLLQVEYTDGAFTATRPLIAEVLFQPYGTDAPKVLDGDIYPLCKGRRSVTVESDNRLGYAGWQTYQMHLLPSLIYRSVQPWNGANTSLKADMLSDEVIQHRVLCNIFEGNWSMWGDLEEIEKPYFDYFDASWRFIRTNNTWTDLPNELIETLNNSTNLNLFAAAEVLGQYPWSNLKDGPVNLLTVTYPTPDIDYFKLDITGMNCSGPDEPYDPLCPFANDNPETRKWKLFYTIYTDGPDTRVPSNDSTVITITAEKMLGVLHQLYVSQHGSYDPPLVLPPVHEYPIGWVYTDSIDLESTDFFIFWAKAAEVMRRLFPFPDVSRPDIALYDGFMFYSQPEQGLFSWDRIYSQANSPDYENNQACLVKFATTGMSLVNCYLPAAIKTIGIRPNITYAGDGLYLCICEKVGAEIVANYNGISVVGCFFGSPFDMWNTEVYWSELPFVEEGYILRHVRPVSVITEKIVLLGVCETGGKYYSAILDYAVDLEEEQHWKILSEIPVPSSFNDPPERRVWDLCPFGSGYLPKAISDYQTHPVATGQQYYMNYSYYLDMAP